MSNKMITLKSSDGESFQVDVSIARQSITISHLIDDDCANDQIPLANVTSEILAKVIEYCQKHVDNGVDASSEETNATDLKNWDAEFMKSADQAMIFHLMLAANYLNVAGLLDLTCQFVADEMLSGKTPGEIRESFNIENDFTEEEEAVNRKEYPWAYETDK